MSDKRITELDSVRGIAAFTVLIHHCALALPVVSNLFDTRNVHNASPVLRALMFSPLHALWNGHSAVILFFVLSGFVLSISFYGNSRHSYPGYVIKRLCRLYIPYFVTVNLAVLLLNFFPYDHGIGNLSHWFNGMWKTKVGMHDYLRFLALKGDTYNLGTTLWTIIIEMEISLILPLFYVIIKRLNFVMNIMFVLVMMLAFKLMNHVHVFTLIPDFQNLYYLTFFLQGGIIYKYRNEISRLKINNSYVLGLIFLIIFCLYNWEWLMPYVITYNNKHLLYVINDYMIGIGGCMLIIMCILHVPALKKLLNIAVFRFLGDISYSLYLLHPIVLLFVAYLFRAYSYGYIVVVVVALCVLLSYIYYLIIERPSMRLGRYLSKAIQPRSGDKKNEPGQ